MTVFETEKISERRAAVIAGIAMLIMAGCAGFAMSLVTGSLIVKGDADATVSNILNSLAPFRSGVFDWLVILVSDIVVSWALYSFLKQVDSSMALPGAWFRHMAFDQGQQDCQITDKYYISANYLLQGVGYYGEARS